MSIDDSEETLNSITKGDEGAIQHLREAVVEGKHWYLALLESIKLWRSTEEDHNGRHYRYLIGGEAFDWLLLAERLCEEIEGYIPENERVAFLFNDKPPLELSKEEFKRLIGAAKYKAYLNYLYGVLTEEALISAVVDEVRKERRSVGSNRYVGETDKAYQRIYDVDQQSLLDAFRKEKKYQKKATISLSEMKEFTYWLFKYRVEHSEKSKVASDTKKALLYMQRNLMSKKSLST
jgi:hypothetical protein